MQSLKLSEIKVKAINWREQKSGTSNSQSCVSL